MKKNFWIYAVIMIVSVPLIQSCSNKQIKDEKATSSSEDLYTCSMHPQVLEHQPGDCPICGMKLIKKNPTTAASTNNIELESLLKPANEFVVASLPVTTPAQKNIQITSQPPGIPTTKQPTSHG